MPERLWKVTGPNGESIHGGSLVWSLPTADGPGEWHEVAGDLRICSHGLHLTREPARWWQNGARCFRVEWEECGGEQDDKIVVRRARCVAEVAWDSVSVFESGDHDVRDGFAVLRGNARAVLWGNARADLWDNARADLWGNAHADLRDNAHADLRDNARADLWGNAHADLWDNARADLRGNARAVLWENATVISSDCHIEPRGRVTLLSDQAVHIIRASGQRPVMRLKGDV